MNEEIKEEWRDVVGYEGIYQVSNTGKVKNIIKNTEKAIQIFNKSGYPIVALYKNGCGKMHTVHRLVAMAFIPNPENKPCIDHIDGTRNNNNVSNLRWATLSENCRNPITKERALEGVIKSHNTPEYKKKMSEVLKIPEVHARLLRALEKAQKIHKKKVRCIETGEIWDSCKSLAKFLKIDNYAVSQYCKGIRNCCMTVTFNNGTTIIHPTFEYVNEKEYENGRKHKELNPCRKKVICIENKQTWISAVELAKFLGVTPSAAASYCRGSHLCIKTVTFDDGAVIHRPHFKYASEKENYNV